MKIKLYINLTNGIEAFKVFKYPNCGFIRIQSTACEQKRWDFILQDLDNDFLLELALGTKCIIVDYSKRGQSRALFQGVEWIKFVLNKYWLDKEIDPIIREHNAKEYFNLMYSKLDRRTITKLKYFKKFLCCNEINIEKIGLKTNLDSKYDEYKKILIGR